MRKATQTYFSICCLIVYMGGLPVCAMKGRYMIVFTTGTGHLLCCSSQRSLHNAPIFRLLLKVAVNGTHQCESHNFCGTCASLLCCLSSNWLVWPKLACAHMCLGRTSARLDPSQTCTCKHPALDDSSAWALIASASAGS